MEKEQFLEIAKHYLAKHQPSGIPIEVLDQRVRRDGGGWYVPVRLTEEIARRTHFYVELAEAELDIKDNEQLEVMFVPA